MQTIWDHFWQTICLILVIGGVIIGIITAAKGGTETTKEDEDA